MKMQLISISSCVAAASLLFTTGASAYDGYADFSPVSSYGASSPTLAIDGTGRSGYTSLATLDKAIDGTGLERAIDGTGLTKAIDGTGLTKAIDGTGSASFSGGATLNRAIDGTGLNRDIDGTGQLTSRADSNLKSGRVLSRQPIQNIRAGQISDTLHSLNKAIDGTGLTAIDGTGASTETGSLLDAGTSPFASDADAAFLNRAIDGTGAANALD